MKQRRRRKIRSGLALVAVVLGMLLAAWFFAGPVKGDPEETMAQMREYQRLARQYPAK